MNPLFLLFLLGLVTYFIVRRVAGVTRTPIWLLWTVAMTPALVWSGWTIAKGPKQPMPAVLVWVPFLACLVLYWLLIQMGRISTEAQPAANDVSDRPDAPPAKPVRPITTTEEQQLQTCFPWSIFYLQELEYRPQAVICRGQLRSQPEVAYTTVRDNVEGLFGDRFLLVFQEAPDGKPVFILVPNPQSQAPRLDDRTVPLPTRPESTSRPGWAIGLLIATFCTTTLAWLEIVGKPVQPSMTALLSGLPYAIALMAILGVHELSHYWMARRYDIRVTLPYFIPVLPMPLFPFGTFGAFIQLRSPVPNRRALFDVGIAGPIGGFLVALPLLLWGLAHSTIVPLPTKPEGFNFQALDPSFSFLLALLSKGMLGQQLTDQSALQLHPVAVAGCLGLVVTAFNLMPVGQLDGGHIVHAMFGQRVGAIIGQVWRLLLLAFSFVQPHLFLWALLLLVIPAMDEPALNDVSELDSRRDLWGLLALSLLLLIILPMPGVLGRLLNG